jgi:phosphoribosyl 1,2-cyclic phosphate phosphodiesterase
MDAILTFLGSGTSMGVPTLGCDCAVCHSADSRDQRLRPSVRIEWAGHTVLIDTGPDFRYQALRAGIKRVDAVFYTHHHADHLLGLDDLRPLSYRNHKDGAPLPLYADDATATAMERVFDYTFRVDADYPNRARVKLHRLKGPVEIFGVKFEPIALKHGRMNVTGYRFGNGAYLTDMNVIPDESLKKLEGLDLAVLDALRARAHASHATLSESIEWSRKLQARQTYFTHMSHEVLHAEVDSQLPDGIRLAYDGLQVNFRIA